MEPSVTEAEQPEAQVVYVFDAYCGWCYGFGPTVQAFWELNRGRVPFSAISGGLFIGARTLPLRSFGFIEAANARVSQLTGATFGDKYQALLRHGGLVLDSAAASSGFAALREQAPDRSIELANAVQRAFFHRGRSLSDAETFKGIAREYDLDDERVEEFLEGMHARAAVMQDFSLARALGATGFPTLLVLTEHAVAKLGGVGTTPAALTRQLDQALERSGRHSGPLNLGR